jgi:hypothetical protein
VEPVLLVMLVLCLVQRLAFPMLLVVMLVVQLRLDYLRT